MVVLIDILHPAHVHFFRPVINKLRENNFTVHVTARKKEMSIDLLNRYKIPCVMISKQKNGIGLIYEMFCRTIKLIVICLKRRPKILLGIMGPSIAVAGFILRIPVWVYYDTENAWITNWFSYPLANRVYTPECYKGKVGKNQVRYSGYHELSYLHPSVFKPDRSVIEKYGINTKKPYSILRFVSWQASHDIGEIGISCENKLKLVSHLKKFGSLFITSESPLPDVLQKYQSPVAIEEIHQLIAFARVVVGESATMSSEAAVLGVPAIFISDTLRGYTVEEENFYHLVYNLSRNEILEALNIISEIFLNPEKRDVFRRNHARLLKEKINITNFIYAEIVSFFNRTV
ncbi:MAG: DUF354 domain-containing protein [Chitinispirillia bacterium]|jgi:predicted glycosyltransferase